MPEDNSIPHCKDCEEAIPEKQGKRGTAYACGIGEGSEPSDPIHFVRHIPGRYTRSSPPWCPKRRKDKTE